MLLNLCDQCDGCVFVAKVEVEDRVPLHRALSQLWKPWAEAGPARVLARGLPPVATVLLQTGLTRL